MATILANKDENIMFEQYKVTVPATEKEVDMATVEKAVKTAVDREMTAFLKDVGLFLGNMERWLDQQEKRTAEKQFKSSLAGQTNSFVNWLAPGGNGIANKSVNPVDGGYNGLTSWLSRSA